MTYRRFHPANPDLAAFFFPRNLRIPGDADQRSGLMAIRVPGGRRSRFRDDADQKLADRGIVIGIAGIGF